MKKLKLLLGAIVIITLVITGIFLVKKKKQELQKIPLPEKPKVMVRVAPVKKGTLTITEHYSGIILPRDEVVISTKLSGYITYLPKSEGDKVKEGEVIVKIDDSRIRNEIDSIKAQIFAVQEEVEVKKKIMERNEFLLKHEVISQEAFDNSKLAYEMAKARLEGLKAKLSQLVNDLIYANIRAPFSGIITKKFKQKGDFVAPGMPILKVENPSKGYKIIASIPQEKLVFIHPGTEVFAVFKGEKLKLKVSKVYPSVDKSGLSQVEILCKKSPFNLPSGTIIGLDIVIKKLKGFIIPVKALIRGKVPGVFVVCNKILKFVPLKVLGINKDLFVAKGNLRVGDKVVIGDPGLLLRLYSGEKVEIFNDKGKSL
ncbi:MAG: efflux RND transporter periplasmic adaptor subunit [Thermodesulfobacteria bacterium]|nr:efflux RND transporter periplasmic adaptor subunit [Thermodesulfobacteriota bacterium]